MVDQDAFHLLFQILTLQHMVLDSPNDMYISRFTLPIHGLVSLEPCFIAFQIAEGEVEELVQVSWCCWRSRSGAPFVRAEGEDQFFDSFPVVEAGVGWGAELFLNVGNWLFFEIIDLGLGDRQKWRDAVFQNPLDVWVQLGHRIEDAN